MSRAPYALYALWMRRSWPSVIANQQETTHADVMIRTHKMRVAAGDYNIQEAHLADAIEQLIGARDTVVGGLLAKPDTA